MKKYISNIMGVMFMPFVIPVYCLGIIILIISVLPTKLIPRMDITDIWSINKIYEKLDSILR